MRRTLRFTLRHRFLLASLLFFVGNHLIDGGPFDLLVSLKAQGAGFTTVTGTITDPNGLKYSCGTISAQLITAGGAAPTLNGGGFTTQTSPVALGCPTSPGTGAPGSFLMSLADSGVIVPSNTTWRFTVNMSPGIAPPAGTGPQSFSVVTAINCSTNTPNTCTNSTIDISALLSASAPAISNSSAGSGSGPSNVVNGNTTQFPTFFADTFAVYDTTYTNGNQNVTLGANDPCFPANFAGANPAHAEGTTWSGADTAYNLSTLVMAETTITAVNSCHSIQVSVAPTGNCVATCVGVFGHVDDAGLTAIETAADAGAQCLPIQLSGAMIWVDDVHFIGSVTGPVPCTNGFIVTPANSIRVGAVRGQGAISTTFFIGSTFNFAHCTGGAGNVCFFARRGMEVSQLGMWGGGNPGSGSHSVAMVGTGIDQRLWDFQIAGFYFSDGAMIGLSLSQNSGSGFIVDAVGLNPCNFSNTFLFGNPATGNFCAFGGGTGCIFASGSGRTVSYGMGCYSSLNAVSAPAANVQSGATYDAFGDFVTCQNQSGTNQAGLNVSGIANLHDFVAVACAGQATDTGITVTSGGVVNNYGTISIGGATNGAILIQGGGVWNECAPTANSYTTGGIVVLGTGIYKTCFVLGTVRAAQTGNVGATTLLSVAATNSGTANSAFRVSVSVNINTAGTSGVVTANVTFVDGSNGATTTTIALCSTASIAGALPNNCQGSAVVHAAPNTVIQWSITGVTTAGTLSFIPWYNVEQL